MINTKTKVAVGAYLSLSLSLSKKTTSKKQKRDGLYNTYHDLLSEEWIAKRSRFHPSYIISPQSLAIFATSHVVGCIEY